MARNLLYSNGSNPGGATTKQTTAFTPSNGSRLVVIGSASSSSAGTLNGSALTITDNLGTPLIYTPGVTTGVPPTWGYGSRIWTSNVIATGASMQIAVGTGAEVPNNIFIEVWEVTDPDTGTATGATATGSDADGNGAAGVTLSAPPASASHVFAVAHVNMASGNNAVSEGSGWTESADYFSAGWSGIQTQVRSGSTSTSVDWGDLSTAGAPSNALLAALEVRVAGGSTTQDLAGDAAAQAAASAAAAVGKPLGGAAAGAAEATANLSKTDTLAGSAQGQASATGQLQGGATITTPPLKNNTGTLLASEAGATVHVYTLAGALVVTKSGQTTNGSGVMAINDALLNGGTTYRVVFVLASGAEGMDKLAAA